MGVLFSISCLSSAMPCASSRDQSTIFYRMVSEKYWHTIELCVTMVTDSSQFCTNIFLWLASGWLSKENLAAVHPLFRNALWWSYSQCSIFCWNVWKSTDVILLNSALYTTFSCLYPFNTTVFCRVVSGIKTHSRGGGGFLLRFLDLDLLLFAILNQDFIWLSIFQNLCPKFLLIGECILNISSM